MVFWKLGASGLLAMACDLAQLLRHAGVEGGGEVAVLDRVELRVVQVERAGCGERAAVGCRHRGLRGVGRRRGGGAAGQCGGDRERKRAADGVLHSGLVRQVGDRKA
jgi:hypothetical protein